MDNSMTEKGANDNKEKLYFNRITQFNHISSQAKQISSHHLLVHV